MRLNNSVSLIILDIDYFKKFAAVLKGFGKSPGDLVARYGGEEFAFILTSAEPGFVKTTAEHICGAVHNLTIKHECSEVDDFVTVSVGFSTMTPSGEGSENELIRSADTALYESKRAGRNTVSAGRSS